MKANSRKSGIILISVVMVLVILSVFALSLGRVTSAGASFIEARVGRAKAYAVALTGVSYTMNLMRRFPSDMDSPWQCGVRLDSTGQGRDYFEDVKADAGSRFTVKITDEARRLNVNAVDGSNYLLLSGLLQHHGVGPATADQIAAAVVDWRDQDGTVFVDANNGIKGAEEDAYAQLTPAYKPKNAAFDAVEELLMVFGMTQEIFDKVKDDLTIFPRQAPQGLKLNFWTASDQLSNAVLAYLDSDQKRVQDPKQVASLTQRYRDNSGPAKANPIELAVLAAANHTPTSAYYRIHSTGLDVNTNSKAIVQAIVVLDQERWRIHRLIEE